MTGSAPRSWPRRSVLFAVGGAVAVLVAATVVVVALRPAATVTGTAAAAAATNSATVSVEVSASSSAASSPVSTSSTPSTTSSPVAPNGCDIAEEFAGRAPDPSWRQYTRTGTINVQDSLLQIRAGDGADIYDTVQTAPGLLRVPTGDFVIEADVQAEPAQFYQGAGLLIWFDGDHYVRLEHGYGDVSAIVYEYRAGGQHVKLHSPISSDPGIITTDADRVVLQLTRTAASVGGRWRPAEDSQWRDLETIPIAIPEGAQAGVAVLNRAQGGEPKPFDAQFDYIRITCGS